ncbi:hypothetical protein Jab_2c35330 [Janthinobacterium sp. HH01]|uniref:hypothetical protein n=1 Tax=Janthinobacterium sp. HH01 TaxID=1198452 RepID=UPI0002AE9A4C|nr:hypothetical protein [Janthinobacterium sp. HH01]ELX11414.1 hypothetical protein Jab_2c35330 [Janthinobacterium sp. HH01]
MKSALATAGQMAIGVAAAVALLRLPDQVCHDRLGNEVLRLLIGLALVLAFGRWIVRTAHARAAPCLALGALLVLMLALNTAGQLGALWAGARAPQPAQTAAAWAWLQAQGELVAAAFCGLWVFFVLRQRAAAP